MPNVVVTAYACHPHKGSEQGVGWRWIEMMARTGWRVHVLTSVADCKSCTAYVSAAADPDMSKLVFLPVGRETIQSLGLRYKVITYIYQFYWQFEVYLAASKLNKTEEVDVFHSLTYGGIRIPSLLGLISRNKVILGPLGGGEEAPMRLIYPLGILPVISEFTRLLSNRMLKVSPIALLRFATAARILAKTTESAEAIGSFFRKKIHVVSDVGTSGVLSRKFGVRSSIVPKPTFIFAGRFLYWKGGELLIRAFARYRRLGGPGLLQMVGDGPCASRWRRIAQEEGVESEVEWKGWLERESFLSLLGQSDLFVFPSLHDSSGNVVFESLSMGVPVLCLSLGGPGQVLSEVGGEPIDVRGVSFDVAISRIAERMLEGGGGRNKLELVKLEAFLSSNKWENLLKKSYTGLV